MRTNSIGTALIGKGYWGLILKKYLESDCRYCLLHLAGKSYPLKRIWNDKKVSLVIIATPNDTHSALVIESLKNGKHVVVEKPLALNAKDSQKILSLSRRLNKFVITDYTQTFSPGLNFLANRKLNIGKILSYEIRVGKTELLKNSQTNNVFWHLMPHLLSVLNMFESIDTFTFRPQSLVESNKGLITTGLLVFEKGFLRASVDYPPREFVVVLYGKNGTAIYSAFGDPTVLITRRGNKIEGGGVAKERSLSFNERDNLKFMLDYVWEVLASKKKSNLNMAMRVTKVLTSF